jgi:recombinational DNA repair protein (RecF pathway)
MEAIEAIITRSTPFEERGHILLAFSSQFGFISLFHKQFKSQNMRGLSPLLKIEAEVIPSEKDLWKAKKLHITGSYQALRLNRDKLSLAFFFLKTLEELLPKRAQSLFHYGLLDSHLDLLKEGRSPFAVASSFLLKLYAHEGILKRELSKEEELLLLGSIESIKELHCTRELFEGIAKGGT